MRNRLQQVCYPPTYTSITPNLVLPFIALDEEEAIKAHTRWQLLTSLIDVVLWTRSRSQVIHNRGHSFSKRFIPAGVCQLPITKLRKYARLHLVGDAPEVPKCRAPLTNNAQIRVAPGESTPNPRVGSAFESDYTVWLRSG